MLKRSETFFKKSVGWGSIAKNVSSTFRTTEENRIFGGPKSLIRIGLTSPIAQKTQDGMVDYCFSHFEAIRNVFQKKCRLSVDCEKCPWYIPYYETKSNFWGIKIANLNRIAFPDSAKDSGRCGRLLLLTCRSDQRRFSKKLSAVRRLRRMSMDQNRLFESEMNHIFDSSFAFCQIDFCDEFWTMVNSQLAR